MTEEMTVKELLVAIFWLASLAFGAWLGSQIGDYLWK